ncbi:MAG TPA: Uma2 family endonuclease [Blastocatellia bacterium]|nr:Uma2 family endonuclease [Blastocatellia bacterium]
MGLPQTRIRYTEDQYLSMERESEERHEYIDGHIYAMAGESPEHGAICTNLTREVSTQLKGTPCQAFAKDMKVRSGTLPKRRFSQKGLYSYPDLVIVCGELHFLDENRDVLINPKVIIEVSSPSTEAFDRSEKFRRYREFNPSLTDYLIVAQNRPSIEYFSRQENGLWVIAASVVELSESIHIASVNCALRLVEVYDRIEFPEEEEEPDDE